METKTLDARGMACPLPVVKAIQALQGMTEGELAVHVDNEIAVQNLLRMAEGKKLAAETEMAGEKHYIVRIRLSGGAEPLPEEPPVCCGSAAGDTVVVISSECMGCGSDELGKTLMKGFLFALSQLEEAPKTVLFYNGGAKWTAAGSAALEDLRAMEEKGTEILTCGTCMNYYGLGEKPAVGSVTNMYSIVEKMAGAARLLRP